MDVIEVYNLYLLDQLDSSKLGHIKDLHQHFVFNMIYTTVIKQ